MSAPICGPAAVDDHRPDADEAQQEHVLGELLLQVGLLHRRPAVLDDEGLALERPDIRQRLDEGLGAVDDLLHGALRGYRMYRERSWSSRASASRAYT